MDKYRYYRLASECQLQYLIHEIQFCLIFMTFFSAAFDKDVSS
jgi:hypothetical protein